MEKKQIIKYGLYAVGGISLIVGSIVAVNKIKKSRFSAQGKKDGSKRKSEDIIGKTVSPSTSGFVNIRSTPEVPLAVYNCSWYDLTCLASQGGGYAVQRIAGTDVSMINVVKKASGNPVGTILKIVKGKDGWNWYQIEYVQDALISQEDSSWWTGNMSTSSKKKGYVREDAVVVNYN